MLLDMKVKDLPDLLPSTADRMDFYWTWRKKMKHDILEYFYYPIGIFWITVYWT